MKVYGRNEVAHEQVPPVLVQLLQAFNNPFIYVLMALAGVSFITDYWLPLRRGEETDLTGVLIILTMVSLSGLLRFWQEFRTNRAAQALKKMVRTTATVLRRGPGNIGAVQEEIPIEELVPGDVVFWPQAIWCPPTSDCWRRAISLSVSQFLVVNHYP